ncbi:unnamed protein product [Arabidopsis halleri]
MWNLSRGLFLWRFDKRDVQCPEYSGEEQAICAVGLAKCRPGVFVEAIQYILVLATPAELVLLGVCCTEGPDGRDLYAEISVQPLPDYTNKGRIFMAGRDGHIYELLYTTGSGWNKRCRSVCLTAGLGSMISRWVVPNVFKFGAVNPVVEMVVDNERQILYSLSRDETPSICFWAKWGSQHFTIVQAGIEMVAALSDGRRMYLSTSSSGSGSTISFSGFNNHRQTPNCLKVVSTRPSPPLGVGVGLYFGAASIGDSSPPAMSSLLVVSRDSSVHSQAGSSSGPSSRSSRALREVVSSLPIEGRMLFVADVLPSPDTAATIQSLYSELEYCGVEFSGESYEKACGKLWASIFRPSIFCQGEKNVVFTTMCMMEIVF